MEVCKEEMRIKTVVFPFKVMLGYSKVGKSGRGVWFILRQPFSLETAI
jgi:hypothetical protein